LPTAEEQQRQRRLVVPAGLEGPRGLEKQPVFQVEWVPRELVEANDYNPNAVAPPELRLLKISLLSDGWTQPLVVRWKDMASSTYELVDGFHRWLCAEDDRISRMTDGKVPIVVLPDTPLEHRMMSTIRHNRARGEHKVQDMAQIVVFILESGMDDHELSLMLQMEKEEVSRLRDRGNMLKRGSGEGFSKGWVAG
jgi:ParB-like chromosome segregation protein Spo0J